MEGFDITIYCYALKRPFRASKRRSARDPTAKRMPKRLAPLREQGASHTIEASCTTTTTRFRTMARLARQMRTRDIAVSRQPAKYLRLLADQATEEAQLFQELEEFFEFECVGSSA